MLVELSLATEPLEASLALDVLAALFVPLEGVQVGADHPAHAAGVGLEPVGRDLKDKVDNAR